MHLLTFGFFNYLIVIFLCTLIDQSFASERLDLPVAFPIFRPPLEAVHRYKTSAEHAKIEEISTNFNNNTSEPSLEGLLGEEEEEALITAEKFREEKINKNNSLVKQHLVNNNTSENIQNLKNLKNETKLRHLNNSINATNVINTPRFPVFTGLGMEIIDSPSNDAETENKFKEEISPSPHQHHHKLHYHLNNKNNTKLNKKYYPLKLNKELTTTTLIPFIQLLPSTIKTFPKHFEENKQIKEENNPFILKQNLSEQNYLNKTNNYLNNSEGEDFESFNLINGTEWNGKECFYLKKIY
uniref:Uncharacterized protein n=1 Tax=Meloidogyne hapla TaxID=6305 RepID=A0A1I8AYK2_MELHA